MSYIEDSIKIYALILLLASSLAAGIFTGLYRDMKAEKERKPVMIEFGSKVKHVKTGKVGVVVGREEYCDESYGYNSVVLDFGPEHRVQDRIMRIANKDVLVLEGPLKAKPRYQGIGMPPSNIANFAD